MDERSTALDVLVERRYGPRAPSGACVSGQAYASTSSSTTASTSSTTSNNASGPASAVDMVASTRAAAILLRQLVEFVRFAPTPAECWIMDAALHVEGRTVTLDRASIIWPDAK